MTVPVDDIDEADEADEESSSTGSGNSGTWSVSCSSSSSLNMSFCIPSLALAQARCRSLIVQELNDERNAGAGHPI